MQEIGKYGRKPLIMVKSGNSRNLSLQNTFQRSLQISFKTTSNKKISNYKVVDNFPRNNLDILLIQNGQRMLQIWPDYCGGSCSFRTPKVGDGFDSNSHHSWWISAQPQLGRFIKDGGESKEGSRGAQEPLDQRGIHPMA